MNYDQFILKKEPDVDEIGYTTSANPARDAPIVDPVSDSCYAKKRLVERDNSTVCRYYIKAKSVDNRILNPWNQEDVENNLKLSLTLCREPYRFVEVTESGFKLYLLLLKQRSHSLLDQVERERIHG